MTNFCFKDPNNYSIDKLKSNKYIFYRNNKQFLEIINW